MYKNKTYLHIRHEQMQKMTTDIYCFLDILLFENKKKQQQTFKNTRKQCFTKWHQKRNIIKFINSTNIYDS